MDFLDQEKYVKAQEEFQFILSRGTGTDYGDDAQFFLAEAYFLNEQFLLSITEYENLTRKMAFSPFFEKSRFRICEAYRIESPDYYNDQSYTEKALERYIEFLDDFLLSGIISCVALYRAGRIKSFIPASIIINFLFILFLL